MPSTSTAELYAEARQVYRQSVADGRPMSAEELGHRFRRSPRWARDRIAEARAESAEQVSLVDEPVPVAETIMSAPGPEAATASPLPDPVGVDNHGPACRCDFCQQVETAVRGAVPPVDEQAVPDEQPPAGDVDPAADRRPVAGDVRSLIRLRWAVRAVLALGVAASIAGNVLHANGNLISQIIAAWSPLALLLTIELISRVPVHRRSLAVARWTATSVIAGIAAWVSYWHMAAVAARYGETGGAQYLLPLSVDGLVVVASVCLVELGGRIAAGKGQAR